MDREVGERRTTLRPVASRRDSETAALVLLNIDTGNRRRRGAVGAASDGEVVRRASERVR